MRIGFISTRFAGTDGVSLETVKWVEVLERMGHECFFFAGESEWPEERSIVVPEAHFLHPETRAINGDLFDRHRRSPETTRRVIQLSRHLKKNLHKFVHNFRLDMLIVENAVSLPMNVPLGLAITELIVETNLPTIAHHHDFLWERERYAVDAAADYLRAAFPPTLDQVRHVVINTFAKRQLALHAGVASTVVPNVMDFDSPPPKTDDYAGELRSELGIGEDQHLLLQPTRIIPRKRIEKTIELARRLEMDCVVLITHQAGDEGRDYETYLRGFADLMDVELIFGADRFAAERGISEGGQKIFSLYDVYQQADLVTYPSQIEGFGNALLESVYCRQPIVTSTYRILKTDIQPKGFTFIEFDDYFNEAFLQQIRQVLCHPESAREMVENNYEMARRHYSYQHLEVHLSQLLQEIKEKTQ